MKNRLYLVDVSSLFFRAYYAVRPLTSPQGLPVNAIYGYVSMLLKLIKEENPKHIVFCYDRKEPSFRKALYDDYKANRSEMPEDLVLQMPYIKKVAELFGIPALEVDSYEADDIIGTLTTIAKKNNFQTYIVSGDKDFAQLVDGSVVLYDTMKNTKLGPEEVLQKWGVKPENFIDYLAIVGDSSDNIPGVRGVGPKGAIQLIEDFHTVEGIYENIDQIKSENLKNKLIESKDNAFLSKKLVTICLQVPVSENMDTYLKKDFNLEALEEFFNELNFKTFLNQVKDLNNHLKQNNSEQKNFGPSEATTAQPQSSELDLQTTLQKVSPPKGFNSEVIELNHQNLQKYKTQIESNYYFIFNERLICFSNAEIFILNQEIFAKISLPTRGYDLKSIWRKLNIQFQDLSESNSNSSRNTRDDMLLSYVILTADSMDYLKVFKRFQLISVEQENLLNDKAQTLDIKIFNLVDLFIKLNEFINEKLKDFHFVEIYEKFEKPLLPILYKMEKRGISININELKIYSEELAIKISQIENAIYELAGEKFNVASPKQLGKILFEKMNIETGKKTKTGYSTDTDVLEMIDHPIAKKIIEFRELSKLKSTYVDSLPSLIDPIDLRIHTHFNQAMTTTGRLSSTNPNIQNIPIRTENGQRVRRAFQADSGKKLLSIDYSQIELRILAHISNDPGLIQAFKNNLDIHSATAAEVFNVPLDQVTSDLRRTAKAINFGIAYGQGAFGLAENLGISRKEAQEIIKSYFSKFSGVHSYIEKTIEQAHQSGFVETLFGRKRVIEELKSKNPALRKFGERAAINAPIQGSASDLVKLAMIEIEKNIKLPLLLQVHDELIFEGSNQEIELESAKIIKIMESVYPLCVPLKVNSEVSTCWGE